MKLRNDLQVLRGLAVLAVLLFHSSERLFPKGFYGVDIFFIISGFVVTPMIIKLVDNRGIDTRFFIRIKYFYKRRFYRLAPALFFTLIVSFIIIFFLGRLEDHKNFARQGLATLLLSGNIGAYKYSGNYFSGAPNPLIHTWSLSIELQIYLLIPILASIFFWKFKFSYYRLLIIYIFITLLSFCAFLFPKIFDPSIIVLGNGIEDFSFYSLFQRIWQFTIGGVSYIVKENFKFLSFFSLKYIKLLFSFILISLVFLPLTTTNTVGALLVCAITIFVILSNSLEALPRYFSKPLEYLGNRSYSIYLIHMPIIYCAKYSGLSLSETDESTKYQTIIAFGLSILLGSFIYSKIENRYRIISREKSESEINRETINPILTFAPPFLFISILIGFNSNYWGLVNPISKPLYSGDTLGLMQRNYCQQDFNKAPCVLNKVQTGKSMLLLGDSHAVHISSTFRNLAAEYGWNVYLWTASCHVSEYRKSDMKLKKKCDKSNQQILNWLKVNDTDTVIVSRFIDEKSSMTDLINDLKIIKSVVPRVLLIENNPIFPDQSKYMVQRPIIMPKYEAPKFFLESEMENKDRNASDLLGKWARGNEITTINFHSSLCINGYCTRYFNNEWLYYDDDHFSISGEKFISPLVEKFLMK